MASWGLSKQRKGKYRTSRNITHYIELEVSTEGEEHTHRFYLADMGGNHIVLGYPWFMASNLRPNWKEGTLAATIMVRTSGAAQKLGSPVSMVAGMHKVEVRNCPFLKKGESLHV